MSRFSLPTTTRVGDPSSVTTETTKLLRSDSLSYNHWTPTPPPPFSRRDHPVQPSVLSPSVTQHRTRNLGHNAAPQYLFTQKSSGFLQSVPLSIYQVRPQDSGFSRRRNFCTGEVNCQFVCLRVFPFSERVPVGRTPSVDRGWGGPGNSTILGTVFGVRSVNVTPEPLTTQGSGVNSLLRGSETFPVLRSFPVSTLSYGRGSSDGAP